MQGGRTLFPDASAREKYTENLVVNGNSSKEKNINFSRGYKLAKPCGKKNIKRQNK